MFILCLFAVSIAARDKLKTDKIFEKYGMLDGSVLVELSTDVLAKNTKISFYKSMIMPEEKEAVQEIMTAIEEDTKEGLKIMESAKNGKVETGYYYLTPEKDRKTKEYILYKNKSKKITLIYLKGDFKPDRLEEELDKLKDLFIYVNKRRIKL